MKKSKADFKKLYQQEWPIKCKDHIDAFAEAIWILRETWESVGIPPPLSINVHPVFANELKFSNHPAIDINNYTASNDPNYIGTIAGIDLMKTIPSSHSKLSGKDGRKAFGDFF